MTLVNSEGFMMMVFPATMAALDPVLEPQHLASVILEEIYGLRHLRVGLEPGLAALVGLPGEQFELAPLHDRRRPKQYASPCLRRRTTPGLEGSAGLTETISPSVSTRSPPMIAG